MKKEDKIQDLVQDFEPSSNKDAMNIKTCMEKKKKEKARTASCWVYKPKPTGS